MSAALTQGHIEGRLEGLALSFETEGEVALRMREAPGRTLAYWRVAQQMRRIRRPYMAIGRDAIVVRNATCGNRSTPTEIAFDTPAEVAMRRG